jgi:hypothetical protein
VNTEKWIPWIGYGIYVTLEYRSSLVPIEIQPLERQHFVVESDAC